MEVLQSKDRMKHIEFLPLKTYTFTQTHTCTHTHTHTHTHTQGSPSHGSRKMTDCKNEHKFPLYVYINIYTNLPVNAIVRLPHPRSGDSQGQERFLAPSADKQTRNYDISPYQP